ncbi:MAG: phospholipase D family protein [Granulosicoccaceae bacterium]
MKASRHFLLFFIVVVCVLGIFRFLGEQRFQVKPETIPKYAVDQTTSLFQLVDQQLATAGPEQSLVVPLGNAHLALIRRIQLADEASVSLDMQYYLFHDDDTGRALLAAAVEAADRGVRVRLLMDDMDTAGRESLLIRLVAEHPNLSIRVFNPVYTRSVRAVDFIARFPRSSRRMHNKSFNADGITAIVGGRNVGNEYFEVNTLTGFLDFDVLAAGPVSKAVSSEFNAYWYSGIAVDIGELDIPAEDQTYQLWKQSIVSSLAVFRETMQRSDVPIVTELIAASESSEVYLSENAVIYDAPQKVLSGLFDKGGWLAPKVLQLMSSAEQELLIVSPYFIPGEQGLKLFSELMKKGSSVTILTNSFAANDVAAVHSGYIDYRRQLLEMGVELFELKATSNEERTFSLLGSARSSLHAKTFLIDKQHSFVGSFNLDPRSAIHNTEMGVVFSSPEYGARASSVLQQLLVDKAYQVELLADGQLQWTENTTQDGQVVQKKYNTEPGTSFWQRLAVYLISWLPVEWLL